MKDIIHSDEEIDNIIDRIGIQKALIEIDIPESYLLKNKFDKDIILLTIDPSENFLRESLKEEYLSLNDLINVSTKSLSNLSQEFINEYGDYINWNRMMVYLMASDRVDNIEKFEEIIKKNNLWNEISCCDLPISFIRKYKDDLNWTYLSICKYYSDEEREEFSEYIDGANSKAKEKMIENLKNQDPIDFRWDGQLVSNDIVSEIDDKDPQFELKQYVSRLAGSVKNPIINNYEEISISHKSNIDLIKDLMQSLTDEEINQLKDII